MPIKLKLTLRQLETLHEATKSHLLRSGAVGGPSSDAEIRSVVELMATLEKLVDDIHSRELAELEVEGKEEEGTR